LQCPGCHQNSLSVRDRLSVALRMQVECPACGVAVRFGLWPRVVHSLLGDAVLVGGIVGAFVWQAPSLVPLAATSWVSLSLLLPLEAKGP